VSVVSFTADELQARAEERGLRYPRHLIAEVVAAIDTGQHVLLTGAPGAGKTSLAYVLADLARDAVRSTGYLAVTASSDWDERHTVGSYVDTPDGVVFRAGVFLDAIQSGRWLLMDELNRADVDRVTLHYRRRGRSEPISIVPAGAEAPPHTDALPVPRHWRIIATMNDVDRAMLHRLSHALMRRFAFIEVPGAPDEVVRSLVAGGGDLVTELLAVRRFVELGPAVFMDAARFAERRLTDSDASPSRVLFEAFFAFILPQLDQLDALQGRDLLAALAPRFDLSEVAQLERAIHRAIGPPSHLRDRRTGSPAA
jgi:MoxR-like ATPase